MKDVRRIVNRSQDVGQAKQCIEQLSFQTNAAHRGHTAVAQRIRDQLNQAYDDTPLDAQICIDKVLDWLDREHLGKGVGTECNALAT